MNDNYVLKVSDNDLGKHLSVGSILEVIKIENGEIVCKVLSIEERKKVFSELRQKLGAPFLKKNFKPLSREELHERS